MSLKLILQITIFALGAWFTYTGGRTLFSKKYYMTKIESIGDKSIDEAYKNLPRWRIWFTRYDYGTQWLILGLGLLALFVYSLFK